jgi:hypothetical protein
MTHETFLMPRNPIVEVRHAVLDARPIHYIHHDGLIPFATLRRRAPARLDSVSHEH